MTQPLRYWFEFCAPYVRPRLGRDEPGASLVEYPLLVALIAVVCIAAVVVLGGNATSKFSDVGGSLAP